MTKIISQNQAQRDSESPLKKVAGTWREKGENAMRNVYGYIWVGSRDQNEERQILAFRNLSIPEKNIFMDKQSGKDFERPFSKRRAPAECPQELFMGKQNNLGIF